MLQLTSFVYACTNKLAPAVFDKYFNYISNIHDYSTLGRLLGVISLLKERTQCNMRQNLLDMLALNHGIQYLLKLEGLPPFQP